MNSLQFAGPKDQFEAVGEVSVVAQDEPGRQTNIVSNDQDWYIRASVDFEAVPFEAVPKETHIIVFQAYLEGLDTNSDISGPEFSDGHVWSPQKQHYDFQVYMKKNSVPTGLYRISTVINMLDKNRSSLAVAFTDVGLIQIYRELL